jgi:hypothetical protein
LRATRDAWYACATARSSTSTTGRKSEKLRVKS